MTIGAGENSAEKKVNVDPGTRVYVSAVAKPVPNGILDIGLFENSTEIHPAMDVSHYNGEIGTFEQRALELSYHGGSEITAKAQLKEALPSGESVEIEVVFLTYTNDTSCAY